MRNLKLLFAIVLLSCHQQEKKIQILISDNKNDSFYCFEICNKSGHAIFILENYDDMVSQDSIIFEPFFTFRGPNYKTFFPNVFYPPKMIGIQDKKCYTGINLKTNLSYNNTNKNYFFRIYSMNFKEYVDSIKVIPYVQDFIKFQDIHSTLVKGKTVEKNNIKSK
jgi:hypothetical protein